MAPPKFGDLGKKVKNLFSDDFDAGEVTLKLNSKAANGMAFKVEGTKDSKNTVKGKLESSYSLANGISFKETWKTNSVVTTEVSTKDKLAKGTKFVFEAEFSPSPGLKTAQTIKADYGADKFYIDTKLVDYEKLSAGATFSYSKWLMGASGKFTASKGFQGYEAGVSYVDSDVIVTAKVNEKDTMEGSVFHKATPTINAGVKLGYNRSTNASSFGVAGEYALDSTATCKAKIDNSLALGLAYTQELRKGVTLGMSANVNAANLDSDSHSLGLVLGFSA